MPEPVGRFNSVPNEYYDLERGLCVGTEAAPAISAEPSAANNPSGANSPRIANPSSGPASDGAQPSSCNAQAAQAGLTCARALAGALEVAPTLVGGLVAAFLGGAACGFAVMEWRECEDGRTPKKP